MLLKKQGHLGVKELLYKFSTMNTIVGFIILSGYSSIIIFTKFQNFAPICNIWQRFFGLDADVKLFATFVENSQPLKEMKFSNVVVM